MSAPMREATHTYRGSREGLGEPLQTLFGVGTLAGLTDGQLLERFADGRGEAAEAAFTALVERHGPMVLGVCRAVLGDRHDAEDALQATFLVLALRAGSIRRGDAVASWLYSAARRVALRARRQAARHRERERRRAAPGRGGGARSTRHRRSPGPSCTKSSIGSPSRSGPQWCSATWRDTPTSRPPACSTARSARSRAGWREDANASEDAWKAGDYRQPSCWSAPAPG